MNDTSGADVEDVLSYMGLTPEKTGKKIAYQHWFDFLTMTKEHSGESWKEKVRLLMRSRVNVDFRYIDDYKDTCVAYGVIKIRNDRIFYLGLPKGVVVQKGKPFREYGPPVEHEDTEGVIEHE